MGAAPIFFAALFNDVFKTRIVPLTGLTGAPAHNPRFAGRATRFIYLVAG
jgi:hypothetical protein